MTQFEHHEIQQSNSLLPPFWSNVTSLPNSCLILSSESNQIYCQHIAGGSYLKASMYYQLCACEPMCAVGFCCCFNTVDYFYLNLQCVYGARWPFAWIAWICKAPYVLVYLQYSVPLADAAIHCSNAIWIHLEEVTRLLWRQFIE